MSADTTETSLTDIRRRVLSISSETLTSADGFELDAAIVDEALDVVVMPMQDNEFPCVECFLVRPRIQLDHETTLGPVCIECASL